jgi:DNA-nicking Smr family endonuclease
MLESAMGVMDFLARLLKQSSGDVKPTLDLHGLSVRNALLETREFVTASFRARLPVVRLVYGKGIGSPGGKGVLREVIPRWCQKEGSEWVERFQREVDLKGGDGSILLYLKHPADDDLQ